MDARIGAGEQRIVLVIFGAPAALHRQMFRMAAPGPGRGLVLPFAERDHFAVIGGEPRRFAPLVQYYRASKGAIRQAAQAALDHGITELAALGHGGLGHDPEQYEGGYAEGDGYYAEEGGYYDEGTYEGEPAGGYDDVQVTRYRYDDEVYDASYYNDGYYGGGYYGGIPYYYVSYAPYYQSHRWRWHYLYSPFYPAPAWAYHYDPFFDIRYRSGWSIGISFTFGSPFYGGYYSPFYYDPFYGSYYGYGYSPVFYGGYHHGYHDGYVNGYYNGYYAGSYHGGSSHGGIRNGGPRGSIRSVQDAIVRVLGFDQVSNLALGLAMGALSHYRFAAVVGVGFVALLCLEGGRRALRDPRTWIAIAFGAAAWAPLLAWNFDNADAGLRFQLVDRHPWALHGEGLLFLPVQAGVVTPLLFVVWFVSGIVMMYVEYPELTAVERLETLPPLATDRIRIEAEDAVALAGWSSWRPVSVKLTSVLGRPAYQFRSEIGRSSIVFADNGDVLEGSLSPAQALKAVRRSGFYHEGLQARHVATVDIDQWTVTASLTSHRPLHKVELDDAAGTSLYVSSTTGQIVRDTNRNERFWNWLGSTIHWVYPWQLRQHAGLWADIVIYLSLTGLVAVATGGLVGWWRLRIRKPYRGRFMTPYRGMRRWHHVLGLATLLFLATFMLSGLLSLTPWNVFANATPASVPIARYLRDTTPELAPLPALREWAASPPVKEIEWVRVAGKPYLLVSRSATDQFVLDGDRVLQPDELHQRIESALPRLLPRAPLLGTEVLERYDDYYYSHHNRHRPLPVLRARFGDSEQSWFHIDLATGQPVNRQALFNDRKIAVVNNGYRLHL